MKKVLVTGGLGYAGGRIVAQLIASGQYEIFVSSRQKVIGANDYFHPEQVKLLDSDLVFNDSTQLPHSFNCIIHLAAYNEIDCAANPLAAAEFNIISSLRLLQKAVNSNVQQFIYFSTAHVYGAPLQGTITEQTIARPVHPYAITHKAFEDFVLAARDKKEIDGLVIRLSNSFGCPVWPDVNRWTLLVNDLCRQAVATGTLKLNSAGKQERDFITLTDVAAATLFLMNKPASQTGNGLFNLGGNYTTTVLQMAQLIAGRCSVVLQKEVNISVPAEQFPETRITDPLVFSCHKLQAAGFQWQCDVNSEIDALLLFCSRHFGVKKMV